MSKLLVQQYIIRNKQKLKINVNTICMSAYESMKLIWKSQQKFSIKEPKTLFDNKILLLIPIDID